MTQAVCIGVWLAACRGFALCVILTAASAIARGDCTLLRQQILDNERLLADPAMARDDPEYYRQMRSTLDQMKRGYAELCGPGAGAGSSGGVLPQLAPSRPYPVSPLATTNQLLHGLVRDALNSRPLPSAPPPPAPVHIPVFAPPAADRASGAGFRNLGGSRVDQAFMDLVSETAEARRSFNATRPAQWLTDLIEGNTIMPGGQWIADILNRKRVAPGGPSINLITGEYVMPNGARIHETRTAANPYARAYRLTDHFDPRRLPGQQWFEDFRSGRYELPEGQRIREILQRERVAPGGPFINLVTGEYVMPNGARIQDSSSDRTFRARLVRLPVLLSGPAPGAGIRD